MDDYQNLLAALGQLKETPVGAVIHDQISRIVAEQAAAQRNVSRVYGMLLRVLMDGYIKNPTLDQVNEINAKLGELRTILAESAPEPTPVMAVTEAAPEPVVAVSAASEGKLSVPLTAATGIVEEEAPPASSPITPAPTIHDILGEGPTQAMHQLPLDHSHEEVARLQEVFSRNVEEAITRNREFGVLLQVELSALRQADDTQEIETLRQILIGGVEELIQSQRALETKLHGTSDYLDVIKSDGRRLRDELNKARTLSLTDEFTNLPNRRAFMRRLQDEIGRAQRYGAPLAVALIDLDHFKAINDAHGHGAGDEVLRIFATDVLSMLRHHDLVARYGGEEFAALLPNTVIDGAVAALNKVRLRGQSMVCKFQNKTIAIPSFSAGLTLYQPGDTGAALIDRADRALYRAKRLGRQRIEVEPAVPTTSSAESERMPGF